MTARARILQVVATDATFERRADRFGEAWLGKCIHCNAPLRVGLDGAPGIATLEHILPRSHGGDDSPENLALACARCNHQKGARLDNRRKGDPRLMEVVQALRERRLARWRAPPSG